MGSSRLPRFTRSEKILPLRLTDRDQQILQNVYRHRFLRSDKIAALVGGSQQQVTRRLQRLFHHAYLERPKCQIDYYKSGSRRIAYGLGGRGASWLRRELSLPFRDSDWNAKNRVGKLFLEHALMVSDFMVELEAACRRRSDVRLLSEEDLNVTKMREPFQWRVEVNHRFRCSVIPDRVFGLEFAGKRCWYFLEADRATMPVTRRGLDRSSFYRKLLAYEATWAQKVHWRDFGIHRFRVLTITTNSARVQSMIKTCQKLKQGHGLFLFSDSDGLAKQNDLFLAGWQSCRRDGYTRLLE
jgi:DNA-binding Lrp family transcriptional regulator